jgi:hypothetical protein
VDAQQPVLTGVCGGRPHGVLPLEGYTAEKLIKVCFEVATNEQNPPRVRIAACAVALPYLAPKSAAVEIDFEPPPPQFEEPKTREEAEKILRHFLGDCV